MNDENHVDANHRPTAQLAWLVQVITSEPLQDPGFGGFQPQNTALTIGNIMHAAGRSSDPVMKPLDPTFEPNPERKGKKGTCRYAYHEYAAGDQRSDTVSAAQSLFGDSSRSSAISVPLKRATVVEKVARGLYTFMGTLKAQSKPLKFNGLDVDYNHLRIVNSTVASMQPTLEILDDFRDLERALEQYKDDSNMHHICYECDKYFVSAKVLEQHEIQSPRHPSCKRCRILFDDWDDLVGYMCPLLNYSAALSNKSSKLFDSGGLLHKHHREEHDDRYCRPCKRVFKNANTLDQPCR
ncbi:hypothetical protein TRAPUB_7181 [Trametes pubescens]|uniref:C2H2-type domain-containing protein n=1 Tax=Trametes pubescens TaxID=154538 RepID=A0A1M2V3V7_TRAPU|nr:hypothetical protein TRAPUB_7181 [Trametes pubescens]